MNPNFKKMKDPTLPVWLTTSLLLLNISSTKCWLYEGFWEKMGKENPGIRNNFCVKINNCNI